MLQSKENNNFIYTSLERLISLKYDIRGFSFLSKQPVQSQLTGKHRSKLRGRGLDFEEVRAYNFGDDIRNMDWKVTARTRKPHTKVFTEERERPVFLVVDQSASMFFGSSKFTKSVIAAEAAALAAWKVFAVGDRVGGIVFTDNDFVEAKPRRNQKAVLRLINLINEKNNKLSIDQYQNQSELMLNKILDQTLKFVTHDYLVVVFSDFATSNDQTIKSLKQIAKHNDVVVFVIKDKMELLLGDDMIIGTAGKQVNLDEIKTDYKKKYTATINSEFQELITKLKNYNITSLNFNTDESSLVQLRKIIGGRK